MAFIFSDYACGGQMFGLPLHLSYKKFAIPANCALRKSSALAVTKTTAEPDKFNNEPVELSVSVRDSVVPDAVYTCANFKSTSSILNRISQHHHHLCRHLQMFQNRSLPRLK